MRRMTILLALALGLAACSSQDSAEPSRLGTDGADTTSLGGEFADDDAAEPESGDVDVRFGAVDDRKVIREASLRLHSSDTRAAFDEIIRLTESVGGFVARAEVLPFEGEDAQPDVSMTLRIPAAELTSTLEAIKESVDEVVSESQGARDVTEEFVDLEARLRNLEALEVELRALLEEVRLQPDADPQKLLTVFNELSSVRGQIEQLQGQLDHLEDLTVMATVQVGITQTPKAAPIVEQPWEPVVAARDALSSLVSSLQTVADWGIRFALFGLPMLLLTVGIPGAALYLVYRRLFRRDRPAAPATPAES